jgi:hypothetical protein
MCVAAVPRCHLFEALASGPMESGLLPPRAERIASLSALRMHSEVENSVTCWRASTYFCAGRHSKLAYKHQSEVDRYLLQLGHQRPLSGPAVPSVDQTPSL